VFTLLAKILSALNSDAEPHQIASAIALAMVFGLNPTLSLMGLLVIVLLFSLRVNLSTFIALFAVFSGVAVLIAKPMHEVGLLVLNNESLQPLFTDWFQSYWFRVLELNNTLVMGAMVTSFVLFIPVWLIAKFLVNKYRAAFQAFVEKFKVVQSLKASKFYQVYQAVHTQ